MTLPYRQERLLRRVAHALWQSDPDLASMLSTFARLTAAEGMPARERLRPQQAWGWRGLLWLVASVSFLVVFVVVFAAGGGSRAATACSTATRRRVSGLGRADDRTWGAPVRELRAYADVNDIRLAAVAREQHPGADGRPRPGLPAGSRSTARPGQDGWGTIRM
jgi:hypothetical protein